MANIKHIRSGENFSQAVIYSGVAYLAGQVASDVGEDFVGQLKQVLNKIDALLLECGSNKDQLIAVQIYLSDMQNLPALNQIWKAWLEGCPLPTRLPIEVKLVDSKYLVELQVNAAVF